MAGTKRLSGDYVRSSKKKQQKTEGGGKRMTLEEQIEAETVVSKSSMRTGKQKMLQKGDNFVDAAMTTKILKEAQKQQLELQREKDEQDELASARKAFASLGNKNVDSDSESEEEEYEEDDFKSDYEQTVEISEEEEKLLFLFMPKNAGPQQTLADLIMEKLQDADAMKETVDAGAGKFVPGVDQKVVEVYTGVGELLSRYTAGKIPKAFKVLVHLTNWEEILYITQPDKWTPNAMFQATRIFASNLNARMATRFYRLVLLPRLRHDISLHKRLHFELYKALKKSVYKPSAFYKGILFPLCKSGTCTLREAVIIGSILQKISIPAAHSSVAILKLAEMDYSGTNSYFLKLLLDKKYALPYRVIDAVVKHFTKFETESRVLPVIWHQSMLTFVQRYKNSLTEADKQNLKHLMEYQHHHLVTPEIKREMQHSLNRGQKDENNPTPMVVVNPVKEDVFDIPNVDIEMEEF